MGFFPTKSLRSSASAGGLTRPISSIAVLHEIKNVRQERGAGKRRWFESDGLELVVWLDRDDNVSGFQLHYDVGHGAHALTWREGSGFAHSAIDSGDDSPFSNRAPVLEPDGHVPWTDVEHLFDERSVTLEPELRQLIHDKLAEQAGASAER